MIFEVLDFINTNQLVPWVAGLLWIGWLVALLVLLCFARMRIELYIQRKSLVLPIATYTLWQALILITLGERPLVNRDDIIHLLRILNLLTILLLWRSLLLLLYTKRKNTCPS